MFSNLLKLLGKAGHNVQQNVTHPQNIINTLARDVQGVGKAIGGALPHVAPSQQAPVPPSLVLNPTASPNVVANLQLQHALDVWSATPALRKIASQTIVRGHQPGDPSEWAKSMASKNYDAGTFARPNKMANATGGEVVLGERGNDPYIAIHELLHNAFARKPIQAQKQFLRLAQQNASPANRDTISEHTFSQANRGQDISKFPYSAAQETHSMLPEEPQALNPALKRYYGQYFNNPNPYQEGMTRYRVSNATGINTLRPGYPLRRPQFSDWQNN